MALTNLNLISRFAEIGIQDRPTVGGKGASLGELARAGIRVPPGCVVTTAAFDRFLTAIDPAGSIRCEIEQLAANDHSACTRVGAEVRARLESTPLPEDLQEEIAAHYSELHAHSAGPEYNEPVAVRSSATSEDSADASFAGLQDTYLWVRGVDSVIQHVRKCWASLYAVESVMYRRRLKLPEQGLAMGVVIQRMIDSRCSGVMFTRSPNTGDRSVVVVEASWGLGSAVVSGEVTPDKYAVGKITGEIISRTVSTKMRQHRPNAAGAGVLDEEVPADQQNAACLSDDDLHVLVDIAKRVERHYACPQDIEWAIARDRAPGENVFLLQSRPETVWAVRDTTPVAAPKDKPFDHVFSLLGGGAPKR
ncbi:MAG: PEP/pyruvate-binding domain-containing protein [Candidatus Acidiferrum sp.]